MFFFFVSIWIIGVKHNVQFYTKDVSSALTDHAVCACVRGAVVSLQRLRPPTLINLPRLANGVCAQTETTLPSLSYFGRFPERIFQAYSLRNFWKMVVRAIIGSPVLSWEHCIMHFL